MILDRKLLQEVLAAAMTTGADFAEVYAFVTIWCRGVNNDLTIGFVSNHMV